MANHAPRPVQTLLFLACSSLIPFAHAVDRVDAEIAPLLAKLAEAGELSGHDQQPVTIQRPERSHLELGAVVDLRHGDTEGAKVMAISPGSAAQRMGIEPGDRMLSVNGQPLTAASDLSEALAATNGALEIDIRRGGQTLSLQGSADRVTVPAYAMTISAVSSAATTRRGAVGCGRISQILTPPATQDIYTLVIHDVDGRLPAPWGSSAFSLSEGPSTIRVSEAIRHDRFTGNQNRKRHTLFPSERYKTFVLDVAPNTTYRLGARLIRENREDIRGGSYWEPVVWSSFEERCL